MNSTGPYSGPEKVAKLRGAFTVPFDASVGRLDFTLFRNAACGEQSEMEETVRQVRTHRCTCGVVRVVREEAPVPVLLHRQYKQTDFIHD